MAKPAGSQKMNCPGLEGHCDGFAMLGATKAAPLKHSLEAQAESETFGGSAGEKWVFGEAGATGQAKLRLALINKFDHCSRCGLNKIACL